MKKIMDIDIVDMIPFSKGIMVARKDILKNGEAKISFITYDVKLEKPTASTKGAYLFNKFGDAYKPITEKLGFTRFSIVINSSVSHSQNPLSPRRKSGFLSDIFE